MEQQTCRNCNHPVVGEYCSHCGQREGRADQRFMDLAGEIVGDVADVDSRFWRTLTSLMFRPGYLTAEFMAGRRARYLPPLRLYLVFSFVVFLVMALDASNALVTTDEGVDLEGDNIVVTLDPNEVVEVADAQEDAAVDEEGDEEDRPVVTIGISDETSPQWLQDLDAKLEANATRIADDPNQFIEDLVSFLPQMMFILLPLFALLVWLAYLFSPFHYLQHLVFALHYHSFVYLLYLVEQLLNVAGLQIGGLLVFWLMAYLPLALRRCYGSGLGGAIGKSLFVYITYGILLIQGFAGVALLALVLL